MAVYLYYFGILLEIAFLLGFITFWFYMIYSDLKGSPYVPSKLKEIQFILKEAKLKKGQKFIDLGCGDGRTVREAVVTHKVEGVGVDVNRVLIWWARSLSKLKKNNNMRFVTSDIFGIDLKDYDVVYVFLMPRILEKLSGKFSKELKKGSQIISHGFRIKGLENKLYKTISHEPFPTYFYRL